MMIFDFHLYTQVHADGHTFTLNAVCQSASKRIAIMGASGSGKSLTVQLLAGLLKPHAGSLKVGGTLYGDTTQNVWLPPQQREVGVVFQDYALFPHLTVAQNIAFGLHLGWRNPSSKINDLTKKWLNRMQLSHLAEHYPHQISGGQKQRVALARSCIGRPRWLLLDEPFSALDSDLRQKMRNEISVLQAELSIPMLLITHDQRDSDVLADEIWCMQQGLLRRQ